MSQLSDFNACIHNKWVTSPLGVQYAIDNDTLYFQCSKCITDWKYNFMIPVVAYKHNKDTFLMHLGFKLLWHDVRDVIADCSFSHIRGYSQGAVFACLAHEDRLYKHSITCDTVVYGSPKFLFMPSDYTKEMFSGITRIANKDDLITKIPPFYSHIGTSIILPKKGKWLKDTGLIEYLSGHSPHQYRHNLENK